MSESSLQAHRVQHGAQSAPRVRRVLLAGNPNSGKTTLFNALTGLRQKVANYPGVTVEKRIGRFVTGNDLAIDIHDLPGAYSLIPRSPDEQIAIAELTATTLNGALQPAADLIVIVLDVTNLARNLYLAVQVLDLGIPTIVVLNMIDEAEACGMTIDVPALARRLGCPVIATAARHGRGLPELRESIVRELRTPPQERKGYWQVPRKLATACQPVALWMQANAFANERAAFAAALRVVSNDEALVRWHTHARFGSLQSHVDEARRRLLAEALPWQQAEAQARFTWIDQLVAENVRDGRKHSGSRSEKIDRVLTHRLWGPVIFVSILALVFQTIFSWAEVPMNAIESGFTWAGEQLRVLLPPGALTDLVVEGALTGVGAVVVFLPQIMFLFFFLAMLEDSGYMARAAFMLDRLMARVGLGGQSVIPLLSSFACAIPGIMATRAIKSPQQRLVTILVAPLMSCSARLPVYTLMIGAFIPALPVLGFISLQGVTLLAMYLLGIVMAILAALVIRRTVVKGESQPFLMELPPYRLPNWRAVLWQMIERARIFLVSAGKIILAVSIVLWFLASYPKPAAESEATTAHLTKSEATILHSYAGKLGKTIEPVIAPLGFDWKIGIGLLTSFAAREVIVSTLATIYKVEGADEESVALREALQRERDPRTGRAIYTPLVALSLMVYFVLACQCMSTVAVVKRETNSWRWPLFLIAYMTGLAYMSALVVYQGGKLMGFG